MEQPPKVTASPFVHVSPESTWQSKLCLRLFSCVICPIIIGLAAALYTQAFPDCFWFLLPPSVLAVCWNVAEITCLSGLAGHRGIYPTLCLIVDLCLWSAYVIGTVVVAQTTTWHENSSPEAMAMSQGAFGPSILQAFIHFILFLIAFHEAKLRDKEPDYVYHSSVPPTLDTQPTQIQLLVLNPNEQTETDDEPPEYEENDINQHVQHQPTQVLRIPRLVHTTEQRTFERQLPHEPYPAFI